MKSLLRASLSIALAAIFTTSAFAAGLPEVKLSASNKVPKCATPGRLMAYLKARNPRLNPRYENLAALYQQHGESLGIRWDVAFFQMILETAALRYTGDVRADQNNFAGLGASGGGARGERFADVSTGVKAHLQHLLMYAGVHIDDPVADRTRNVQEWGVLTDWQRSIDGPMTYTLVAQQWAPTSRNYVRDITTISDGFYTSYCNAPDPDPGVTQEARQDAPASTEVATLEPSSNAAPEAPAQTSGADIAKRNIERERSEGGTLNSLGAGMLASVGSPGKAADPKPDSGTAAGDSPPVTLLNAKPEADTPAVAAESQPPAAKSSGKQKTKQAKTKAAPAADKGAAVQTASIGAAATQLKVTPPKAGKCKVWTASYGGPRAVIIKANASGTVNYTVLDVTDANEKREVDAYIAAYAKGGERIATFPTQTKALTKAFELCPEG